MKKCNDCNVEMLENFGIRADEPISIDNKERLYVIKNPNDIYGRRVNERKNDGIKCRICPNCGKVELFVDPTILK